ncbi:hypothetical protein BABINDRAFT_39349 [Babjeviella inositovora NRRL Y-12698]|uniref:Uncharacterized protein n=1 Tax=Babjeviella inositovora NRRL Y-12698 TaxID=984486 RepID=A0A1E3QLG2_9ASCO|nr:uncharacterized protein BABINDRAFT_39349 [Babjeviella inositovora NRRL Y-12698]ODQ78490.1 hypothetical protein BABINDRAFT_39349 [Babjeviella inositovora NRRL Y-12698]
MGIQQAPQTRKVADTTKPADGKVALVDVSLFLKQLSVRLTQLYNLPRQYRNTKLSIHGTASQPIDLQRLDQFDFQNSNYITFYNTLWLVLNDLFLGLSVSNLLRHYETEIQTFITKRMIQEVLIDRLGQLIDWLMDNPAGFKLNDELTSFIGELFLWTVRFWTVLLEAVVLRYIQLWIKIIPYVTAFGGLSFAIGMVMDLVQLITFHTFCFQFSAARLYHWQISILRSLFKLIVGKRINVLRDNRTDKVDFSFDQLLLGTVLFMVLVYLVPTVFAFYLPFTLMRKGIQGVRWGCDRIIHWLNYFPLFVVLLKIKNNRRLPGGLRFELQEVYPTTVFKMSNESVSFATIFK